LFLRIELEALTRFRGGFQRQPSQYLSWVLDQLVVAKFSSRVIEVEQNGYQPIDHTLAKVDDASMLDPARTL